MHYCCLDTVRVELQINFNHTIQWFPSVQSEKNKNTLDYWSPRSTLHLFSFFFFFSFFLFFKILVSVCLLLQSLTYTKTDQWSPRFTLNQLELQCAIVAPLTRHAFILRKLQVTHQISSTSRPTGHNEIHNPSFFAKKEQQGQPQRPKRARLYVALTVCFFFVCLFFSFQTVSLGWTLSC